MMIAYTANETHKWKFIEKDNGNNHQSSNKTTIFSTDKSSNFPEFEVVGMKIQIKENTYAISTE